MCHCGAVVKELLALADKPGSTPGDAVFCLFVPFLLFFFCLVLVFPFRLFFFILTTDPAGHSLGSIYILNLSPEYYFGKGISRVLDLHTGQAYGQKKPQAVNLCPLSSQTAAFFEMLVDIMTNNTQVHLKTVLVYTQHPPVIHWRNLDLPFVHRLNYQYYYPKISKKIIKRNLLLVFGI